MAVATHRMSSVFLHCNHLRFMALNTQRFSRGFRRVRCMTCVTVCRDGVHHFRRVARLRMALSARLCQRNVRLVDRMTTYAGATLRIGRMLHHGFGAVTLDARLGFCTRAMWTMAVCAFFVRRLRQYRFVSMTLRAGLDGAFSKRVRLMTGATTWMSWRKQSRRRHARLFFNLRLGVAFNTTIAGDYRSRVVWMTTHARFSHRLALSPVLHGKRVAGRTISGLCKRLLMRTMTTGTILSVDGNTSAVALSMTRKTSPFFKSLSVLTGFEDMTTQAPHGRARIKRMMMHRLLAVTLATHLKTGRREAAVSQGVTIAAIHLLVATRL